MNTNIVETNFVGAILRIQRKKDIDKIGFGKGQYFETRAFYNNLRKNGLKGFRTKKDFLAASHFRMVNKGYPRGDTNYRTYNEKKDKQLYKGSRHNYPYLPEIIVSQRSNRRDKEEN